MPTYDFKCNKCGKVFEVRVKSDAVVNCPKCNSADLKKLITGIGGISFIGDGFYVNDYKDKDKGQSEE